MIHEASRAVFLSYASQDADAARRIADALRAAGVEVWFDQSELRGGDSWDQKIRRQIKECAMFVPVISANTQARAEGYFRLEWKLAVDRSHLMADDATFLFPVVVDATTDAEARVPDRFREVQWTRVRTDETPAEMAARVARLLSEGGGGAHRNVAEDSTEETGRRRRRKEKKPAWLRHAWSVVILAMIAYYGMRPFWQSVFNRESKPPATFPGSPVPTEARKLVERSQEMLAGSSLSRDQLDAAGQLCERAIQLDPSDPLVWAEAARVELLYIYPYGYDKSDERRRKTRDYATRAANLAPSMTEVRIVQAMVYAHAVGTPALMAEAEKTFRELVASSPSDERLTIQLAEVLRGQGRFDEAAKLFESVNEYEVAGWSYFQAGELRAALSAVSRAKRSVTSLVLKAHLEYTVLEDLDASQATINQLKPSELLSEIPGATALSIAYYRRDPARMLELIAGLGRPYLDSNAFRGPSAYYSGLAHELAGRRPQAEAEWRTGLAVIEDRLKSAPEDPDLMLWSAWLRAALGENEEAERILARRQSLEGLREDSLDTKNVLALTRLRKSEVLLNGIESFFAARPPGWEAAHAEMRFNPGLDFLRGDPRFQKLLRDNLPEGAKPLD